MNLSSDGPGMGRLWWGVAASPMAWVVTELVGYPMVARSCAAASAGGGSPELTHTRVWMVALTVVLAAVGGSGVWVALTNVRATSHSAIPSTSPGGTSDAGDPGAPRDRAHFMAVAGAFVSSIFLGGTVLYGIPSLIVNVCAQAR